MRENKSKNGRQIEDKQKTVYTEKDYVINKIETGNMKSLVHYKTGESKLGSDQFAKRTLEELLDESLHVIHAGTFIVNVHQCKMYISWVLYCAYEQLTQITAFEQFCYKC